MERVIMTSHRHHDEHSAMPYSMLAVSPNAIESPEEMNPGSKASLGADQIKEGIYMRLPVVSRYIHREDEVRVSQSTERRYLHAIAWPTRLIPTSTFRRKLAPFPMCFILSGGRQVTEVMSCRRDMEHSLRLVWGPRTPGPVRR